MVARVMEEFYVGDSPSNVIRWRYFPSSSPDLWKSRLSVKQCCPSRSTPKHERASEGDDIGDNEDSLKFW